MNAIQPLASQPWVERLGWTLIHFLWQGTVFAALYAAARRILRGSSPNARYLLGCAALSAMMAAPLVTWRLMRPPDAAPNAADRTAKIPAAVPALAIALPASVRATVGSGDQGRLLPWVVGIWLLGASGFWVRLMGGWVFAARMRSLLVRPAPAEWQQALHRLGAQIGVSRPVRLLVSAVVQAPTVVGWIRPVVLMPLGALAGLPPEHVEALLIHELAHIRRHDYLVNMLQSAAEALLFYHPAVWWVSGHMRTERELCCDDIAVSATGDVFNYARALAELESYRPAHFYAALAANGGSLAARIARLLGRSRPAVANGPGPSVLIGAVLLAAASYGLFAQSEARPAFQVASIKPNSANPPRHVVRALPGGRLSAENAFPMQLIVNAYSVLPYQVVGAPGWIDTDGFDIEAKPEAETDRPHTWLMLQTLLADRFKLAVHRETRQLPVYVLVAAKGGLKLQPPKDANCQPGPPSLPGQAPCGMVRVSMGTGGLQMVGDNVPMAELVRMLAGLLARPVIDRSAFTGTFYVHVEFTPDENTAGLPPPPPGAAPLPTDPNRPNIHAALQEQLGLKLESSKGPVEVLVIDHVERPSAN